MLATRGSGKVTKIEARANKTKDIRTPATAKNQRTRTCYECGSLRHYKSECPIVKFHKRVDMILGRVRASKPKKMQDAIEIASKLMNKKISTLVECQTENKKRLDNTTKNNQNEQQPKKRQNTGRAYTARHGEKNIMADLSHCVLNETITMMVHVLPNATSATNLAIYPVTVGVLQMPILLTSKKALKQVRRLHAMNVGTKGTTGEIVWRERTKTMKTKSKV
nr:hypothetical protein [Tanacetum cinerariifolium]